MTRPPRFRSLRWQLPLSYAAIALVAVLALGITLLGTLRGYYREQERAYLASNAAAIAGEIAPLLTSADRAALQAQITAFSFLTQTRIDVWDAAGETVLARSGDLAGFTPAISVGGARRDLLDSVGVAEEEVMIVVEEEQEVEAGQVTSQRTLTRTTTLPAQGSLYGFNLGEAVPDSGERSTLSVRAAIVDSAGQTIGHVQLAQGPAYGRAILRSVAAGWAMAGAVAVLLAAFAGWLVSRRLTQPLLALTAVTGRMAQGDLSARADLHRGDELGVLGATFNTMAAQVEQTVRSLRRFTADAAHELHTPLTALQTDLQLLEDGEAPAQQRRVARAQAQARRLQDLADNLLELSRLEAETAPGGRTLVDVRRLLQTTGELYASQAEQAGLDFELHLPEAPVLVSGDESQLRRALANVLDNSLKFTPPPGTIALSLATTGDHALISVRDSGIGIPPEDLPHLTSRFHRGRNASAYPGNGLGLAIVHEILARHQGQLAVESDGGRTLVQLRLPVSAE